MRRHQRALANDVHFLEGALAQRSLLALTYDRGGRAILRAAARVEGAPPARAVFIDILDRPLLLGGKFALQALLSFLELLQSVARALIS